MSLHPLEASKRILDGTDSVFLINRITNELSELANDLAIVESFSHCVAWDTGDGLICFDASGVGSGAAVVQSLRGWRPSPITNLIYTHGHADHVGGSFAFAADATTRGHTRPHVISHENVKARLERYRQTNE